MENYNSTARLAPNSTYTMTLLAQEKMRSSGADDFYGTSYGAAAPSAGRGQQGQQDQRAESEAAAVRKNDLWTRREAADYLGVCEQTLAVWKTKGRYGLPVVKIGRLVRYRKIDLDAFIERRTQAS